MPQDSLLQGKEEGKLSSNNVIKLLNEHSSNIVSIKQDSLVQGKEEDTLSSNIESKLLNKNL